ARNRAARLMAAGMLRYRERLTLRPRVGRSRRAFVGPSASRRSASASGTRPLRSERARRRRKRGFRERRNRSRSSSFSSGTKAARGCPCLVNTTVSRRQRSTYSLSFAFASAMDATFTTPYLLVSDPQALTVLHADRDDDDRRALDRVEGSEAVLWAEADLPMRAEGCRQGEQLAVTRLPRRLVSQRRPESPQDECMIPLRQCTNMLHGVTGDLDPVRAPRHLHHLWSDLWSRSRTAVRRP